MSLLLSRGPLLGASTVGGRSLVPPFLRKPFAVPGKDSMNFVPQHVHLFCEPCSEMLGASLSFH